jgi:hypothetical protein
MTCVSTSATRPSPARHRMRIATWFAIVHVGKNSASSIPRRLDARASRVCCRGSSRRSKARGFSSSRVSLSACATGVVPVEWGEVVEAADPHRTRTLAAARSGTGPGARTLIGALVDSEWAATRWVEALCREVIVAGRRAAPIHATRTSKVGTGWGDARALAEACLLGMSANPRLTEPRETQATAHYFGSETRGTDTEGETLRLT